MQLQSWDRYYMLQRKINFFALHTQWPASHIKCPTLHSMDTADDRRLCHVHGPLGAEKRPVLSRCPI